MKFISYCQLQINQQYCWISAKPLFKCDALESIKNLPKFFIFLFSLKCTAKVFFFEQEPHTLLPDRIFAAHLIPLPPRSTLINSCCHQQGRWSAG